MKGDEQTKEQLLNELAELRRYVSELEKSENKGKRAKKAQLSSENFYKTIFEKIKTATAVLGEDDTILLANEEFEQLTGYAREEVEGKKKWTEFIARKEELERMKEYRRLRFIDQQFIPQQYEFQIVDRKGQVKDILTTIAKIPGKKQTLTTLLDITDRRRADAALSESKRRLADIIEFLPDPTFAIDLSGKVIAWNHAMEEMTGVNTEDILGKGNHEYAMPLRGNRKPILIDQAMGVAVVDEKNFDFVKREGDVLIAEGEKTLRGKSRTLWGKAAPLRDSQGNITGAIESFHDITELKQAEEALQKSEKQVRRKLDAILSPEGDIGTLELSDIIDTEKIQKLMDEFFDLTNLPMTITDLNGKVLVGIGWQDICTNFHRVNPESCRLCIESDLELTSNVQVGTFKKYRCKNNMWDIATPIMLGDKCVGNIFMGQFLFDNEKPDYETFRQQARKYGFDQQEYIEALDRVPRWSEKTINKAMSFFSIFAEIIGNLGYSNIKLANALEERKRAEDRLRVSEEKFRSIYEESPLGIELYDRDGTLLDVNRACLDIFGISDAKAVIGVKLFENPNLSERLKGQLLRGESVRCEIPYDFGKVTALNWYETTKRGIIYLDILITPLRGNTKEFNIGYLVHTRDITDRKRAEKALQKSEEILRSVFKTTPVGLCIMKDRVFQSVNKSWLDICGYSESEIIDHTPRLLFEEEEEYERVGRELYTNLSKRDVASIETKHRRKDGHIRDVILTAALLHLGDVSFGMAVVTVEDITERKKAEEALRGSEAKYRRLHESITEAFASTDMNGRIVEYNSAYQSMLGYSEEELLRLKYSDITPPKWHALEKRIVEEQILVHGYSNVYEKEYQRKDGSVFPVEMSTFLVRDEVGNPVGMWAIVHDITDRKKMETELNSAKDYLSTVFNNVYDAIFVHDLDGKVIDVNDKMLEMYGVSREEAIGLNIIRDYSVTDESMEESLSNWNKVMSGEHIFTEWKARRPKDGFVFDVEVFLTKLVLSDGDYILANVRDITERKHAEEALKESEKKYNQFFKTSRDCVFITIDGSLIDVNDAAVELLGYSSREELLQVKVPDLYAEPEAAAKHFSKIAEYGYGKEYPVDLRRKDGSIRHTLVTSAARFDANGDLIGFQGTIRDVTEQRRNEEELRKYREELEIMVAERTRELEDKTKNLEDVNTTLNVLLKKRDQDKKNLEENFVANIGSMVLPYLENMRKNNLDAQQQVCLNTVEKNLDEIASPLLKNIQQFNLTPREIEIAYLIKDGKTTKEIAGALGIVEGSIATHRKNIRKKLGLDRTCNLQSQLRFLEK